MEEKMRNVVKMVKGMRVEVEEAIVVGGQRGVLLPGLAQQTDPIFNQPSSSSYSPLFCSSPECATLDVSSCRSGFVHCRDGGSTTKKKYRADSQVDLRVSLSAAMGELKPARDEEEVDFDEGSGTRGSRGRVAGSICSMLSDVFYRKW
ncbi:unnamed protein product [Linum tenue]|uniref:Uncharacterized protein n=1 Tax=Linum tenue TaxID=586396 RepID=A0AAV0GY99_9ROSI|nr:unnamed protein product [Linum tenue]